MGPTCEILLEFTPNDEVLDALDCYLADIADTLDRTRRGHVWNIWVGGQPVHVSVSDAPGIALSAGCGSLEDYALLRRLAGELAAILNGVATDPRK